MKKVLEPDLFQTVSVYGLKAASHTHQSLSGRVAFGGLPLPEVSFGSARCVLLNGDCGGVCVGERFLDPCLC